MKSIDKYLFQALDNYPYCLQETLESLEYSMSYNDKNAMTLCLYGRIFTEQLFDYENAKIYFQEAITADLHAVEVYPYYIETLLLNEDFEEAAKLIAFSISIKGSNKVQLLLKKVMLQEIQKEYKAALKTIKEIKKITINNVYTDEIETTEKRIKGKMKAPKKSKKKEKNKKPKASKKEKNAKKKKK